MGDTTPTKIVDVASLAMCAIVHAGSPCRSPCATCRERARAVLDVVAVASGAPSPWTDAVLEEIRKERLHQIADNGWTPESDDRWENGELAMAAACSIAPADIYAERAVPCGCREAGCLCESFPRTRIVPAWPFAQPMKSKGRRQDLIRGIAMGVAEVERIDRAAEVAEARRRLPRGP